MTKVQYKTLQATLLLAVVSTGLVFSALMAMGAIGREFLGGFGGTDININGVWVERNVAPYVAEQFELRPEGVFVNGRQVSTRYEWDGTTLSYRRGEDLYIYTYLPGEFIRQQPAHYISSFTRQGTTLRDIKAARQEMRL
ncbi:DUF2850 domain-containing protein [Photobacterium atrarenae]|uniref:DUF2850 domain-containing protein n=1 Tax=Photobacterium atrarenae TaxID=865757 RepID=A0ABY5GGJ8_9GAMM|nr:DUF2850 domain-containing protein [Photobacterium atrarenae]UTV28245.1 DUF2850 domain-containing protein [Photobacterium atrarenae]